jgi:Zn-dependent protease
MDFFIKALWENPQFFFSWSLFVIFSICCHEYMHARVALMEGDVTAAERGYLTLNPFKQMGLFSLVMLALIGICWGMVPVNPANFRRKSSDLIVSLAGPLTNLALAIIFIVILFIIRYLLRTGIEFSENAYSAFETAFWMIGNGAIMNLVLFFFNILPIPGFDGWSIVRHFVSVEKMMTSEFINGAGVVVLLLAMYFMDEIFMVAAVIVDFILKLF